MSEKSKALLKHIEHEKPIPYDSQYAPTKRTAELTHKMASYGVPISQIAAMCKLSVEMVKRYYGDDIERGLAETSTKIGAAIVDKAVDGDMAAAALWAKSNMGWSDVKRHEFLGAIKIDKIERVIIDHVISDGEEEKD